MKKIIIIFSILAIGCDPIDDRLIIANKTGQTIYFELAEKDSFEKYPIKIDKADTLWDYMNFVHSKQKVRQVLMGKNRWERFVNQDCKDSTLRIFFFDESLLKSTHPDSILLKQLYSKKFAYKVTDLEKLNWEIAY